MTMNIEWMRGCATALVTPFTSEGAVDTERFRALVERQIAGGVKLLVPCGTTGESATMTEEEDREVIMAILRERPENFRVLSGDDAVTLPLIALGADGIVSVVSNEIPDLMSQLTNLALDGDWQRARELHYRLLPLMEVNFIESSPGPVKAAMAMMGLLEENFRLPLVPITEKSRARIREVIGELGLLESVQVAA